ncbi:PAS domain S-box protein [Haloferax larsenii]|uniref:histidine kinase n=1 Tax=Haloferax larsenii TaxID=302484 RepID=A0ABY5RAL7_HALLR|nr:histidine kinase N-terminal 7TM domain-containing protein [Haloferax larsenii]UVE49391.1 PAS domain S-box protein [Haloferax larsenii]
MTNLEQSPFLYALFTSGVLAGVVTIVVLGRFRLYSRRVRIPFALLSLSGALWLTAYGFQLLSTSPAGELFYARIAWVGAATLPTFWLVFSLVYAGEDQLLTRRVVAFLSVEPALAIALALTSDSHGLFVPPELLRSGMLVRLTTDADPLLVGHVSYVAAASIIGVSVIGKTFLSSDGVHQRQAAILVGTGVIPLLALAWKLFWDPSLPIDPVPLSLGVSAGIILWALYRYRLFDVTPIARDAIISEMRDAVVVLDDHHRVVESNGSAASVLEHPAAECIGQPVLDVIKSPDVVQKVLDGRDRLEAAVGDGTDKRYFEIRSGAVSEQSQNRAKLLVFHDVTERRQTEEEFRALIENSRDIITVLDEDGVRQYTSPSMEDVLGFCPESLVGEPVFSLVHPDDREHVREDFEQVMEGDSPVRSEFRIRHKNGTWRRFETVGVNLLDDPSVNGIVLNSRDVTNRYRYEQRLRVLNRVLRHDLRNDMNVILGHADLLLDERIPAESKDHARTIKRKASSLVELGEQTRHIDTTLDRGTAELEQVEVIQRIEKELDGIDANYPRAIVHRDLPDEQWVYADDLIESAIKNLIDNAIEHNDRVLPEVSVSVEPAAPSDDFVEIHIEDNGPGIPDAELSVLESGIETPLQHISGLGLWLVRWIVDRSHGRLRFVENEPRGTVAIVSLRSVDGKATVRETASVESD